MANNEYGEGEFVVNTILSIKSREKLKNSDFAIFYRTNAQSRIFEDFLRRENLPYRIVGGLKFYERKEIKDILAYLKFLVNPADTVALHRIINTPARGIGKASQERIAEIAGRENLPEWIVIRDELMTGRVPKGLDDFRKIIVKLVKMMDGVPGDLTLSQFMKGVIDATGYRESLREENTLESNSRLDNLDELLNSIYDYEQTFPDATPANFMQDILLYTSEENPSDDPEAKTNSITLMTVHNAKGLEFPVVFLTGMEEDTFPHKLSVDTDEGIEEERRLCYVGITRAMDRIYLTSTDLRRSYMGPEYKRPSRFLSEIPRELIDVKSYTSEYSGGREHSGGYSYNGYQPQRREQASTAPSAPVKKYQLQGEESRTPAAPEPVVHRDEPSASGSQFSLRERVAHPKYGTGRIVKIEGSGDNIKLTISFGITNRVFMEKYTPLQKMN